MVMVPLREIGGKSQEMGSWDVLTEFPDRSSRVLPEQERVDADKAMVTFADPSTVDFTAALVRAESATESLVEAAPDSKLE